MKGINDVLFWFSLDNHGHFSMISRNKELFDMGGSGSGHWSLRPKKTQVEECHRLSIFTLKKYLHPGNLGTIRWLRGEQLKDRINFYVIGHQDKPTALQVSYTIGNRSDKLVSFNYQINLTTSSLSWGGERYWFECPLEGCVRRVGCLYLPPDGKYFGCRHCYDLVYASQYEWHKEKIVYKNLVGLMQGSHPGFNWEDIWDVIHGKHPRHWGTLVTNRYIAEWENSHQYKGFLSAKELCQQSGLSVTNLKTLDAERLLVPDTQDGHYRPKLVSWGKKLAHLLSEGWEITEIKAWAKGRWKSKNPKQWPPAREDWSKPLESNE